MEAIQNGIRAVYRIIGLTGIITVYFFYAFRIKARIKDPLERRRAYTLNASRFCGYCVRCMNVEVLTRGEPVPGTNFLYVGNHMGFLDIFVLASIMPSLFVTSQEMRETPLLGDLCEVGGCVFVERRSRTRIVDELKTLVEGLDQGLNIVLYPEATSSNAEQVLPFKKTLMMAGPHAGKPIQPGCINVLSVNGEPFTLKWRDSVCWYGDMNFAVAVWNMVSTKSIKVEVEFLEPIFASADSDRTQVAHLAHERVNAAFRPVTADN